MRWRPFVAFALLALAACDETDEPPSGGAPPSGCSGARCSPPDLAFAAPVAVAFTHRTLDADACEVTAGCAGGPGLRHLANLQIDVVNLGAGVLDLGSTDAALFASGACDPSPVIPGLVGYHLLGPDLSVLASGKLDVRCVAGGAGFTCSTQGMAIGATARLELSSSCNFVDVSDAPLGSTLELALDPDHLITEGDTTNNVVSVPVNHCDGVTCGGVCCPADRCASGMCLLPDLVVDEERLAASVSLGEANFGTNDCALVEECADGPGSRRLLGFSTMTPNLGNADLVLGDPSSSPQMVFSPCHGHYHFDGYAEYRLLDSDGRVAARGHKQAFCLLDSEPVRDGAGPPKYDCDNQGISMGWADEYWNGLDCQWVDITGLSEGDYVLEVQLNHEHLLEELSYANNTGRVPVHIPADPNACLPSAEVCGDGLDQDCDGLADDGCPPVADNDTCETAHQLTASGVVQGTLAGATADMALPCGGAGPDVVFTFDVMREEIIYLSTYGSSAATVLALYKDDCSGAPVGCSNDACDASQSHLVGSIATGRYYVVVKGETVGETRPFQLKLTRSGCAGAPRMGSTDSVMGNTSAGESTTSLSCAETGGPEDFWYLTTCPSVEALAIDTCGSSFSTAVEIRRDSCRGPVPWVGCSDEGACTFGPPRASLYAPLSGVGEGDGLWFVVVDGVTGADHGDYVLHSEVVTP